MELNYQNNFSHNLIYIKGVRYLNKLYDYIQLNLGIKRFLTKFVDSHNQPGRYTAKDTLPYMSNIKFWTELNGRHYENIETIQAVENFFNHKRGYVVKIPKPGTPVILLTSGGLDSTIIWNILLEKYKLKVYPLHSITSRPKKAQGEMDSINYFTQYFKKRYPKLAMNPFNFTTNIPPPELDLAINTNEKYQLKVKKKLSSLEKGKISYLDFSLYTQGAVQYPYPFYALLYAAYLYNVFNTKIRHIVISIMPSDGISIPAQTFTALRTTLLDYCTATGDYSWNLFSLSLEKEFGHWWEKPDLIKWADKYKLPMEKTWTCNYEGKGKYQCGGKKCGVCLQRRDAFKAAKVKDKTKYLI